MFDDLRNTSSRDSTESSFFHTIVGFKDLTKTQHRQQAAMTSPLDQYMQCLLLAHTAIEIVTDDAESKTNRLTRLRSSSFRVMNKEVESSSPKAVSRSKSFPSSRINRASEHRQSRWRPIVVKKAKLASSSSQENHTPSQDVPLVQPMRKQCKDAASIQPKPRLSPSGSVSNHFPALATVSPTTKRRLKTRYYISKALDISRSADQPLEV